MAWPEDKKDKDWDGADRRANTQKDHDLLIRIDEGISFLKGKFESHVVEDRVQWDKIDKINLKIAKWTGLGTGAGVILGFILKAVFH